MAERDDVMTCETCGTVLAREDARRAKTMGGLDPAKWQTLYCPHCGSRLKTVYVGD